MRHFTNVHDLGDLKAAVKEALEVKSIGLPTNTWGRIKP